ncbi:hypothetical protein GE061_005221 [Apolygus lucorum]|uniref:1-acyl-sn-glycerol-3-phosphate acyltransferase n=1 Tax=Apolygus lucorum TaxID=248454 RepID=A0A8S9WY90_APOLU|nr:hypothetical protein GE061_005221 [Apolygus lucorum]
MNLLFTRKELREIFKPRTTTSSAHTPNPPAPHHRPSQPKGHGTRKGKPPASSTADLRPMQRSSNKPPQPATAKPPYTIPARKRILTAVTSAAHEHVTHNNFLKQLFFLLHIRYNFLLIMDFSWLLITPTSLVLFLYIITYFSGNKRIRFYVTYFFFCLATLVTSIVVVPFTLFRPRNIANILWLERTLIALAYPINIRWSLRNVHRLEKDQAAVVVSNHQSIFDILGIAQFHSYLTKCVFIAKKEVLFYPFIGLAGWLTGVLFVDRSSPKAAVKTLQEATNTILAQKAKLFVFPEGTRSDGVKLLPFKKGAFVTAIRIQKPIIPVVFSPYHFIDFKNKTFEKEGRMIITVLNEIPTTGMTEKDVGLLMEKTYKVMETEFNELSIATKPKVF